MVWYLEHEWLEDFSRLGGEALAGSHGGIGESHLVEFPRAGNFLEYPPNKEVENMWEDWVTAKGLRKPNAFVTAGRK